MFENGELLFLLITNVIILLSTFVIVTTLQKRDTARLNEIISAQDKIAGSPFNLDTTLQLIVDKLQVLTKASGAVVELVEGDELSYRATSGSMKAHVGFRMKFADSLSGLCISTAKVIHCTDTETDSRVNLEATRKVNARSMIVAPLQYEGAVIGVLKVAAPIPNFFRTKDELTVKLLSSLIGPAIAHQQDYDTKEKLLQERSYMALHDKLTGLPNRSLFMERLSLAISQMERQGKTLALLFLDLDGFKNVNDTLGHQKGDILLQQVADRLKRNVREVDCVARLGGDEFTIILENLTEAKKEVFTIAEKIINAVREPYDLDENIIQISTSIGIAIATKKTSSTINELITLADTELYKIKNQGKNQFSIIEAA